MTPEEYGRRAATRFNANNPDHFPGRPLFEDLVGGAVREAVAAERERCAAIVDRMGNEAAEDTATDTGALIDPDEAMRRIRKGEPA